MPPSPAPQALPLLFGKPRTTLGWQGYTTEIPSNWNPGKFSGNRATGDLRIDDENGVRLELRWEEAKKTPDVQKSVSNFLDTLTKDAKKKKLAFKRIDDAKVVSRSKSARIKSPISVGLAMTKRRAPADLALPGTALPATASPSLTW